MKKYKNLILKSKSKNMNKKEFFMRLQNGYALFVYYLCKNKKKSFFLNYHLCRVKEEEKEYLLSIDEGDEITEYTDFDDVCTIREEILSFKTPEDAINYLEKNEYFKCEDWRHSKKSSFQKNKKKGNLG
jgi:hypothetical protein